MRIKEIGLPSDAALPRLAPRQEGPFQCSLNRGFSISTSLQTFLANEPPAARASCTSLHPSEFRRRGEGVASALGVVGAATCADIWSSLRRHNEVLTPDEAVPVFPKAYSPNAAPRRTTPRPPPWRTKTPSPAQAPIHLPPPAPPDFPPHRPSGQPRRSRTHLFTGQPAHRSFFVPSLSRRNRTVDDIGQRIAGHQASESPVPGHSQRIAAQTFAGFATSANLMAPSSTNDSLDRRPY
ncbi:hypothetical protein BDK51DRAFT_38931 [Blyttiomyces helicus]|uniref:Uncharacterized protein n=1 Tax=Blyttiomyces helicus TaxID=388810 RepID=A0A4V1IRG1_9FUNG|nr:hypothetical protein BDK51DRAFT_38931 [Blyttiomyces helicus]|eukprot:RKO89937.1 hypothetical protein BDK51DRAFT_38931 [Blyttiomyces helicus]